MKRGVANAFTIIELLVSISILALLIAIIAPSLGKTMAHARSSKEAVAERNLFAALSMYMNDSKEGFPHFGPVGDPFGSSHINGLTTTEGLYFKVHASYWATLLVPNYVPDRSSLEDEETTRVMIEKGREGLILARSAMTMTAFADPRAFALNMANQKLDFTHYRGTRLNEVAFPSQKIILATGYGGGNQDGKKIGFNGGHPCVYADGSVKIFTEAQLETFAYTSHAMIGSIPIHTTIGGLAGRDVPATNND